MCNPMQKVRPLLRVIHSNQGLDTFSKLCSKNIPMKDISIIHKALFKKVKDAELQ